MKRLDSYSQHFLRSPRLVHELVGHSNIRPKDIVIDLGAGSGVISSVLAKRARRVIAVENEPAALRQLTRNVERFENVQVLRGDMMNMKFPEEPYKIFANIPFHLSSPIVRRLTSSKRPPTSIYLIVQKQFANKLLANNQHFTSQLGAELAPWWGARVRRPLRKTDFTPPPAVDTVLLELKPRTEVLLPDTDKEAYIQFVHQCYEDPRYFARLPRSQAGINPELSPSGLTAEQWSSIFKTI